jgi:hypothetical protein
MLGGGDIYECDARLVTGKLEQRISVKTDAVLVNEAKFTSGSTQSRDSGLHWITLSMANILYNCYGAGRQQHAGKCIPMRRATARKSTSA